MNTSLEYVFRSAIYVFYPSIARIEEINTYFEEGNRQTGFRFMQRSLRFGHEKREEELNGSPFARAARQLAQGEDFLFPFARKRPKR